MLQEPQNAPTTRLNLAPNIVYKKEPLYVQALVPKQAIKELMKVISVVFSGRGGKHYLVYTSIGRAAVVQLRQLSIVMVVDALLLWNSHMIHHRCNRFTLHS